jgi:hypothetical protein
MRLISIRNFRQSDLEGWRRVLRWVVWRLPSGAGQAPTVEGSQDDPLDDRLTRPGTINYYRIRHAKCLLVV